MNNISTLNGVDLYQKKSSGFGRFSYALALSTMLNMANPIEMKANNVTDDCSQNVEMVQDSDILKNINRRIGVSLPSMYTQKFKDFIANSNILQDEDAMKFTEDFIVRKMQSVRGINRQNQLLFIWDAVYEQITSQNIYTGEDGDNGRLAEFESVMDKVEQCGKDYNTGFKAHMRQRSANAQQRSANAQQRSANAQQRSADAQQRSADANRRIANAKKRLQQLETEIANIKSDIARNSSRGLQRLNDLYTLCKNNSNYISSDDLKEIKRVGYDFISLCKQHNIDYKSKLSLEVRRFYGVD